MIIKIDTDSVNEEVIKTLIETLKKAKHASYADVVIRSNGDDIAFEADWLKYSTIIEES